MRFFASDNFSGVHPEIMQSMFEANTGHVPAYGSDAYTEKAQLKIREHFGKEVVPYFVLTGTAANVLGLKTVTQSYHAIICPKTAHIATHECGAVENYTGCQLITLDCVQGKLTPDLVRPCLKHLGSVHSAQPKVISISQSTELGTIYTIDEIKELAQIAHQHGLYLHMDGARLSNAAAALGSSLKAITFDCGVDVLSFGGTKNGLMFGDVLIFSDQCADVQFPSIQKQAMQLNSKMRYMAVQFQALLSHDLWLKSARHANQMAKILEEALLKFPKIQILQPVMTNMLFVQLPKKIMYGLQKYFFFLIWDEQQQIVRFITSWDTERSDIDHFIAILTKEMPP